MKKVKIAVVADTHVPDRTRQLEDAFLDALKAEKVDLILHAGDVCVNGVIETLSEIAPVAAVRGNRDFLLDNKIRLVHQFEQFGLRFVMIHGHMGYLTYWVDKLVTLIKGYDRDFYIKRFDRKVPGAHVYIFGHTHHAENFWKNGKLYFNPGSITHGDYLLHQRSWGILEVYEDQRVEGRVILYP